MSSAYSFKIDDFYANYSLKQVRKNYPAIVMIMISVP